MDQAVMELSLWSPWRINWAEARRNISAVLAKIAQLTVPAIGWNPVAAEILPLTDNKGTMRIIWQATGTPALIAAIIPLLPVLFSIIKSLVVGLLIVNGLKVITGTAETEAKAEVTKAILHDSSLTGEQKRAAIADASAPAPSSTPLAQTTDLIKIAAIAAVVVAGGFLLISAMPRRW